MLPAGRTGGGWKRPRLWRERMRIGIMARNIARSTLEETLDVVRQHGIGCVQFGLSCVGVEEMPLRIDPTLCSRIRREMEAREIGMVAISGTFNMIDPDQAARGEGLRRLDALVAACGQLGTSVVHLCTGTRDPVNMWRQHRDNDTPAAWADLLASLGGDMPVVLHGLSADEVDGCVAFLRASGRFS